MDEMVLERLAEYSCFGEDPRGPPPGRRHAAVLVILYASNRGELRTVLTVRSSSLTHHPGEVALPGGRFDPHADSNIIDTAYRETEEEIGVRRSMLKTICVLPDILSRVSNFVVTPVVAVYPNNIQKVKFNPNPGEVSCVFTAPLKKFLHRSKEYSFHILPEDQYPLHVQKHNKRRVMGLTCNILIETARIAYALEPEFDFEYPCVRPDEDALDQEETIKIE